MIIEQVRKAAGLPVESFKKHPSDLFFSDDFDEAGIFAYYKTPGVCEAVEIVNPANPAFQEMSFIGKPYPIPWATPIVRRGKRALIQTRAMLTPRPRI